MESDKTSWLLHVIVQHVINRSRISLDVCVIFHPHDYAGFLCGSDAQLDLQAMLVVVRIPIVVRPYAFNVFYGCPTHSVV